MKVFRAISRINLGNRGDTIVEVMIAIAVLGAALGGAYVSANRNSLTNRAAQERVEAIKIAENQFERIKALSSGSDSQVNTIFNPPSGSFCITPTNQVVASSSTSCLVDAGGNSGTSAARYRIVINKSPDITSPVGVEGADFTVNLQWDGVGNRGAENLSYKYEVYR